MKKIKGLTASIVIILFTMSCTQPITTIPDKVPEEKIMLLGNISISHSLTLAECVSSITISSDALSSSVTSEYNDELIILSEITEGTHDFTFSLIDSAKNEYYKKEMTITVIGQETVRVTIDDVVQTKVTPLEALTPSGIISPETQLLFTAETDDVVIYYTIDGSIPDTKSKVYEGSVLLSVSATLKAIGVKKDLVSSDVISVDYTVSRTKATSPVITPLSGDYDKPVTVAIASSDNSVIYYTDNDATPDVNSKKFTAPFVLSADGTYIIKAITFHQTKENSEIITRRYVIINNNTNTDTDNNNTDNNNTIDNTKKKTVTPIITASQVAPYKSATVFQLLSATPESKIYYTTNGTDPEVKPALLYSTGFSLPEGTHTVKAIAVRTDYDNSDIFSNTITINTSEIVKKAEMPNLISDIPSPYKSATKFQLVTKTESASIYYTTSGTNPAIVTGNLYKGAFSLAKGSYIIKAIAVKDGYINSDVFAASVNITDEIIITDFIVHFKKPAAWSGVFIHYWQNASSPITNWFSGGVAMTENENGWYSFTFNKTDLVSNKISFLFKDKAGAPTNKSIDFTSRSMSDPNWYWSDSKWYSENPETPAAPSIVISPENGSLNGDDKIKITITSVNNPLSKNDIQFAGKTVTMTGDSIELTVKDYISVHGNSAQLSVNTSNSVGDTNKVTTFTRNDEIQVKGITLYFELPKAPVLYVWITDAAGKTIASPMGGWPGKTMTETHTGANSKLWYVFDAGDVPAVNFILNAAGGSDQSRTQTGWLAADGKWYDDDPYKPSAPVITVNFSNNAIYKWEKSISIAVTARNATVDTVTSTSDGSSFNYSSTGLTISDIIKTNMKTSTIVIEASNSIGTTKKSYVIKRDDNYSIPTGIFTWDNALVYFVLTDRFFDGDKTNNLSYDRKRYDDEVLDIATFHGGDLKGLTMKIEEGYFNELGVNAIWMTAAYEQIHGWVGGGSGDFPHYAYHGYYALDWTMLDRNMGTVNEMRELVKTAHKHNIRIVMDVVVNHAGYNSVVDMYDYGFASYDKSVIDNRLWTHPLVRQNWQSHHGDKPNGTVFYKADQIKDPLTSTPITDWLKWWGADWVRCGIEGYEPGDGSFIESPLAGLPDIRTEKTSPVAMAPIMKTKWSKETTSEYDPWIVPANKAKRNSASSVVPADFIISSLAGWVEEFGIDGFRVDTAKHVELFRWKQLKEETDAALKKWRASSRSDNDPAKNWTEDFWMTGEVWDQGVNKNSYYSNGFDSLINFTFPHKNGDGDVGSTWDGYAKALNTDPDFNALTYINSHDMGKVGFFGKGSSTIKAGTALVLSPGGVQIFYGDENDRAKGPTCSDPDHPVRSDYQWGANPEKLAHWNKIGQFRNLHFAVGAGLQETISSNVYYREATVKGILDKIVIAIHASGSLTVDVTGKWTDGIVLRDFYTGNISTVTDGKVTFEAHQNGVILIEEVK